MKWLVFLLACFFEAASAASYSESVAKINSHQGSIQDYALACEVCSDRFGGGGNTGFLFRREVLLRQTTPSNDGHEDRRRISDVVLDIRNGFLSMRASEGPEDPFSTVLTMAVFTDKDKRKTLGVTYEHSGLDSESYEHHFYRIHSGKWIDVTGEVFASISLADFAQDRNAMGDVEKFVNWRLRLPRYGTTALLFADEGYGLSDDEHRRFLAQIGANASMELRWDPATARFAQGKIDKKVISQEKYGKAVGR